MFNFNQFKTVVAALTHLKTKIIFSFYINIKDILLLYPFFEIYIPQYLIYLFFTSTSYVRSAIT